MLIEIDTSRTPRHVPPLEYWEGSWALLKDGKVVCEVMKDTWLGRHLQYVDEQYEIMTIGDYLGWYNAKIKAEHNNPYA